MNILITGGFGYLGQRLGKYLHESGATIYLGTRHEKKNPDWLENGSSLVTNWEDIPSFINKIEPFDLVIHAAGMNASECSANPDRADFINGVIVKKLLDSCIKSHVKNFIFLSTAHVYSGSLEGLITEESPTQNSHPYAKSNIVGENFVIAADKSVDINCKVLRLSNCFGAPLSVQANCWNLLVNNISLQAIKHQEIKLNTSGSQLRDFIPINEFCRTVHFIIHNCMGDREYSIFNVAGKTFSILEMANLVATIYANKHNSVIKIKKEKATDKDNNANLQYKMGWLTKYNFKKSFEPYQEIEELLIFCKNNFLI